MDYDQIYIDMREPRFSFEQIAGYENVKEKFREMIVVPLKYREELKKASLTPPTGVIVWGPLGTGKGHLIEAAAKEAGTNYILIRGRECTDKPEVIKKGFQLALKNAPCVVHLMDIDWLCPREGADYRWKDGTTTGKPDKFGTPQVHQTVYKEVERVASVDSIIVAASSYRIDVLDQAFTRTNMLGRKIYVPMPNKSDRLKILKYYLRNAKLANDVNLKKIAEITEYYVGWDLEALCRKAILNTLERSGNNSSYVTMRDMLEAKEKIKPWLSHAMAEDYNKIISEDCIHKYNF